MTKGTKAFRIIISILVVLTMLWSALLGADYIETVIIEGDDGEDDYGIFVVGVEVTRSNRKDILGDGTVSYDEDTNILTFDHAEIEYDDSVVYSKIDLMIELIGENKFKVSGERVAAIHAGNYMLSKDVVFLGDGSLSIEFEGTSAEAMGIFAKDIRIETDITIDLPDCSNIVNGIYSEASLILSGGATVTVNNGAAAYSTAVKARNNVEIERGSSLNVSIRPGVTEVCRGLTVGGSLSVWDNASLNVSVDDEAAKMSECIHVPGLLIVRDGAEVTASSKKAYAIQCYGSMELNEGANVSASKEGEGVDLVCYGAIVNCGAAVRGEVEALGGVHIK